MFELWARCTMEHCGGVVRWSKASVEDKRGIAGGVLKEGRCTMLLGVADGRPHVRSAGDVRCGRAGLGLGR